MGEAVVAVVKAVDTVVEAVAAVPVDAWRLSMRGGRRCVEAVDAWRLSMRGGRGGGQDFAGDTG